MHISTFISSCAAFTCTLVVSTGTAFATPQASVSIEQISGKGVGVWTLISGNGTSHSSTDAGANKNRYSLGLTDFGPMTLSVVIPQGMSVKISVYRGGELSTTVETPQYSFGLFPNDTYRFLIQYSLNRVGALGVTSNPSGVRFRMKSQSKIYSAVTPFTFINIPAGQYSVQLASIEGCLQPRPQTAVVIPEERETVNVTMNCEKNTTAPTVDTFRPTKRALVEYAKQREFNRRGERK